jgi:hypothetical protein
MQACINRVNALCIRLHQAPELFVPPLAPKFTPVAAHAVRSNQRRGMEDRHVVVNDFNSIFNVQVSGETLALVLASWAAMQRAV